MDFQRLIHKNTSDNERPNYLKCLRLVRNGNVIDVSGDSLYPSEREFYYSWSNCKHTEEVIVLNPPDLCHIYMSFDVKDGSTIASVCPNCTKCDLNTVRCHNKSKLKLDSTTYLVTDLSKLPGDMYVHQQDGQFYLNKAAVNVLPDELKDCVTPIHHVPEAIILRTGPQHRSRKKIRVGEALVRQERANSVQSSDSS